MLILPQSVIAADCPEDFLDGVASQNISLTADTYDCSTIDLTINSGVTVTALGNTTSNTGLTLILNSLNVEGTINGNARGFSGSSTAMVQGDGPGGGSGGQNGIHGGGGGHGAFGGRATSTLGNPYGSMLAPITLGSGGGSCANGCTGGHGGGAIRIIATTSVAISGSITANGGTGGGASGFSAGGGGGGSIYITAASLSGSGSITANGGSGINSGGGVGAGGRIAIFHTGSNTFDGPQTAFKGTTGTSTGTVSNPVPADNGTNIIINSTSNALTIPTTQMWSANPSLEGSVHNYSSVQISGSSTLSVRGYYTTNSDGVGIVFNVANFTLGTGSSITGNSYGYAGGLNAGDNGSGPGGGQSTTNSGQHGAGGGYGGAGGNSTNGMVGGSAYGSESLPTDLGSGGGASGTGGDGGLGGGALQIHASDTITLSGNISVNGGIGTQISNLGGGGGAGGGVLLVGNILTGGGGITATGGAGGTTSGGCGAGGRISTLYRVSNSLSGTFTSTKGTSCNGGTDGTVYNIGIPQTPTSHTQYKTDDTTVISPASATSETSVILKVTMAAGSNMTLIPEFEVRDIDTSFTNSATNTGSGVSYTGTGVIGQATVSGLTDATNYHWQARVCDISSRCSDWTVAGGDPYDFRVFTNQTPSAPSSLGPAEYVNGSSSNDTTPTLTFTQSDPDAGNTVYYTIEVSTLSNFSTSLIEYSSALGSQGATSFTVGQPLDGGTYWSGSIGQTLTNGSYYWRVKTTDENGATSDWSTANSGEVAFVIDSSNPDVNATNLDFSNADDGAWLNFAPTVTWTAGSDVGSGTLLGYCLALSQTDIGAAEPSDDPTLTGGVLQGLDDGVSQTYCPFIATGTSRNLASLNGLTLTTNKHYYVSIAAVDTAGNFYSGSTATIRNLLNFKFDNTVPTNVTSISGGGGSFSNIDDMYFSWPTSGGNAASDSESGLLGYQYSINDQLNWHGTETHSGTGLSIIPVATVPPLFLETARDSTYIVVGDNVIYFRSVDLAGNLSSGATYRTTSIAYGGEAPTFAGDAAITVTPSTNTINSFSLAWDAAIPATNRTIAKYYWMVNTTPPANLQTMLDNPSTYRETTSTSVGTGALPAVVRGSNTVYVVSIDDLNNYSPSNFISKAFTLNTENPDYPKNITVSDASIKSASLWRASLAWDPPDNLGLGSLTYTIQRSSDGTNYTIVGTTSGTAFVDTVASSSRYYWQIKSADSSGSSEYSNAVTLIPKGSYTDSPGLTSGPVVTGITTKKAKITWSTSRTSDSKVAYGTQTGEYFDEEPSNSSHVTDHTINLINLSPGTTYYYVAKWTDEDGNTGNSGEKTFSTQPAPTVQDVIVSSLGLDSAIITFTTKDASKVKIYFGKSTDFGGMQEVATSTLETTYSAQITGLEDGVKYYYKINSFDSENAEYEGTILDFTTLPRPRISQVQLQQVADTAESTILVSWVSNTFISSIITIYPTDNPSASRDLIDLTIKDGAHSMVVSNLFPATDYTLLVKGSDKQGNQAVSSPITFTTATDTRPPAIINLKVIGGTIPPVGFAAGSVNAQLVVTWDTDEPATSQVEYGEGSGSEYSSKTTEDGNLTTNHVVVISGLTPSQVYHLRAISLDAALNQGRSIDTVTIAPKATRSALDLVISNLSLIFGNIRLLGF